MHCLCFFWVPFIFSSFVEVFFFFLVWLYYCRLSPNAWRPWLSIPIYEWIFRKMIEGSVSIHWTFQLLAFTVGSLGWCGFFTGDLSNVRICGTLSGEWCSFPREDSLNCLYVLSVKNEDFPLIARFSLACLTPILSVTSCPWVWIPTFSCRGEGGIVRPRFTLLSKAPMLLLSGFCRYFWLTSHHYFPLQALRCILPSL